MLELIWAPLLGAFSLLFDEYSDPCLLSICLSGFAAAACLAASLGVKGLRDVYVTSLCNFTGLHSPGSMKPKNGLAFRALLRVAVTVGDALEDKWLDVLRCISRWELLQQMASGMPTDAALFAAPGGGERAHQGGLRALKDQLKKLGGNAGGGGGGGAAAAVGGYQGEQFEERGNGAEELFKVVASTAWSVSHSLLLQPKPLTPHPSPLTPHPPPPYTHEQRASSQWRRWQ